MIELMIVVAIIGLLAAIALPNYTAYVVRSNRQNAKAGLMQAAQWMERAATAQGAYPTTLPAAMQAVEGKRYTITLDNGSTASQFTLRASLVAAHADSDPQCGNFTLTQTGVRGVTGTLAAKECWGN